MKRIICFLIAIALLVGIEVSPVMAEAQGTQWPEASVSFNGTGKYINVNKIACREPVGSGVYETKDGVKCITVGLGICLYLNIDLDDNAFSVDDRHNAEITVRYYDEGTGYFTLRYNNGTHSERNLTWPEKVELTNTKEWKTHTFALSDVLFNNSTDACDFAIVTYSKNYDYSATPVYISDIHIKEVFPEKPVDIELTSEQIGNIFDDSDEKQLYATLKNITKTETEVDFSYTVYTEDGNVAEQGKSEKSYIIGAGETETVSLTVNTTEYGVYDMVFHMNTYNKDDDIKRNYNTVKYQYSIVNKLSDGEKTNDMVGTIMHTYNYPGWDNNKILARQIGIGNIRTGMTMQSWSKGNGEFEPPEMARHIEETVDMGMQNLALLTFQDGNLPKTEEGWLEWEQFVDYYTKRYKGKIRYYDMWNEPNYKAGTTAEDYLELMKRTYPIIKRNDPEAMALGLVTAQTDFQYIEKLLKLGAGEYMDALCIHPYDFANDQPELRGPGSWCFHIRDATFKYDMLRLREMMKTYGCPDMPIVASEVALTSTPGVASVKAQAAEIAQLYALNTALGEVETMFWYASQNFRYSGSEDNNFDPEANFGLWRYWEDTVPNAAKPSYVSMAAYNKMMTDVEYIDGIEEDRTKAFRFKRAKDGKQVITLWCEYSSDNIALNLGTDTIEIYDMYSNKKGVMHSQDGIYSFTPTFEPLYIMGDFKKLEKAENVIFADNGRISAVVNDHCTINFTDVKGRNLRVKALGTPYAKIIENDGIKNGIGQLKIDTLEGAINEEPIEVAIYDGEELVYYARLHIVITDKSLSVTCFDSDEPNGVEGRKVINASVTNLTAGSEISGVLTADLREFGGEKQTRRIVGLKPTETKTVFFNVPVSVYSKTVAPKITVEFDNGFTGEYKASGTMPLTATYNRTSKKDASVFDGKFSSGSWFIADARYNAHHATWRGAEDVSFKGTVMYDEENFYMYLDVTDDVFNQPETGDAVWKGDGVQIGIQNAALYASPDTSFTELAVSHTQNGIEIFRFSSQSGLNLPYGEVTAGDAKVEHIGRKAYYKIALPWSELIGKERLDGTEKLKFAALVNDNDGSGRKGFMKYAEGLGSGKTANLFTNIYFGEKQ